MRHHAHSPRAAFGLVVGSALVLGSGLARATDAPELPPPASRTVEYAKDIRPILAASCYSCHGPEKQKSDLRLDLKPSALKGGAEGPVILPGKSADSPLIERVAGIDPETTMPPEGKGKR